MKPLEEQDHYELLEISPQANAEEIERAYQMARSVYADESMAGLSVFEAGDADVIRERVEIAYRTLVDLDARRVYDAELAGVVPANVEPTHETESVTLPPDSLEDFDPLDANQGEFDGTRLRRLRIHRGIELEKVAEITKVNPAYLRFIEEERFDDLPAAVYVRGFVLGYAGCVGLDPRRVAKSYMSRYEESRNSSKRRLFGRR
ncbi:MAG: helix-turn-helix domain-containing protein [Myxococcota bacterium]